MNITANNTATPPLQLERDGAIATLRLNRPEALNAIDVPMANAFLEAAQTIAADASVRAVVLAGNGRGFMAGGDLATLRANPVQGAIDILTPLNQALVLLAQINAPVIAQVHGAAAGAGMSLLLMADYVIAAEGTRLNLAYINLGTSCDVGASWACARRWRLQCWATRFRPTTPCAWASSIAWCPPLNWRVPPPPSPSAWPRGPLWPMAP